jgi:hypothetical protein
VWRGDRIRRASGDAARAFPAVIGHRLIGGQVERGEDRGEEEPCAEFRMNEPARAAKSRSSTGPVST